MFRAYAGDLRFVDVDGDGIMTKGNRTLSNHGDLEIIGNQSPRYQYSINMSLNWNGIGLSMLLAGRGQARLVPVDRVRVLLGQVEPRLQLADEDTDGRQGSARSTRAPTTGA